MPAAPDPPALRLFVAIELCDAWLGWIRSVVEQLRPMLGEAYRFVRPELLHITVCFLGSQRPDRVQTVVEALETAVGAGRPFRLLPDRVGGFGGRRPRVIWVGATDISGELSRLRARIDESLDRREISFDRKSLIPHITVARPRANGGRVKLRGELSAHLWKPGPLEVRHVDLMNSRLGPAGPRYELLHRARLRGSTLGSV